MTALQIVSQPTEIIFPDAHAQTAPAIDWFPDLEAARREVLDYYETLPSASTEERFSQRDCKALTLKFLHFLRRQEPEMFETAIPTQRNMQRYAAYLQKHYAHRTVVKYMTYARHIARALARQKIDPRLDSQMYKFISEYRHDVLMAADISNPRKKIRQKNENSVYAHGTRLTVEEAQAILDHIDTSTLPGKRDAALFMLGFSTGFRLSELARISLASINEFAPGEFSITVRAKGNKFEPRSVDTSAIRALHAYIDAYNDQLPKTDPRRIIDDGQPVWRALTRGGNIFSTDPGAMSSRGLSKIITRTSKAAGHPVAAHDLRRTWAAWALELGMPEEDMQEQMLHESITQTREYCARPKDVGAQNIFKYGLNLSLKS